jgi:hypothetical protein
MLPEVQEWCIDYSDGLAVLWLVTPRAWYRIGGSEYGYLRPHPLYAPIFDTASVKFRACAIACKQLLAAHRRDPHAR